MRHTAARAAVAEKHVDEVLPLVLSHRVRPVEEAEEETVEAGPSGESRPE